MLNQTISKLILISLSQVSPFSTISTQASFSSVSYHNSHFSYFLQSQFYSIHPNIHLLMKDNSFSYFLQSSIVITSFYLNDTTRHRTSEFEHPDISINHCLFSNCRSDNNGGAIKYDNSAGELFVYRSVFQSNFADSNGGGIYYDGVKYEFVRNCFEDCIADNNGQAYHAKSQTGTSFSNDTNILKCSKETKNRNGFTTFINNGASDFHYNNYSNSHITRGAAAMATLLCEVKFITYCQMMNNSAYRILDFQFSVVPVEIFRCNLINNVATVMTIIGYSFTTLINDCYFQNNSKPITSQPAGRPHTITFLNCIYDAFGITQKNGINIVDCRPIQIHDTTIPITQRYSQPCRYNEVEEKTFVSGVNIKLILLISGVIIIVHCILIHGNTMLRYFNALFGTSQNRAPSRRRMTRGFGAVRLE
ncbi:hypothetical protein TRFO_20167 [Tritrichomonas foetus]|uniref:Right handed beta helix domain-containing protein n=1 Tax=Tritrichomonas foetus TaxID=1144522 RepID=A0A1J4KMA8_9EUKA|nr:hypothetical protein TRFO_20167 [Tritrichomonas foetus]|eukprot:OHT10501.1 hypothetical protein TRFO_20167 [Tritrichomonas foetus]